MEKTNDTLGQMANSLWGAYYQGEFNNLFRDENPVWRNIAQFGYNTLTGYLQDKVPKWTSKATSSNNPPTTKVTYNGSAADQFKSNITPTNNNLKLGFDTALATGSDKAFSTIGQNNLQSDFSAIQQHQSDFSNFLKKTPDVTNSNYYSQNAPQLDLQKAVGTDINGQVNTDGANGSPFKNIFDNFSKDKLIGNTAGSVAGMGVSTGLNALGNKVLGNSAGSQFATQVVSNVGGQVAGNVATTFGANLANGASATAGMGSNLASMFSNAGSLTSLGAAVGNIALDVFDKRKKAKWESAVNLGLGVASIFSPYVALASLAFNGIGHAAGGSIEKGFKADRDILAKASTYRGSIKNILDAESLSGAKYTVYANSDRHEDEGTFYEGKRQYDIMNKVVSENQNVQDIAAANLGIKQVEDQYNAAGGYSQIGTAVGKEGMVLQEKPKTTSIRLSTFIKIAEPQEFKEGGIISNVTRIKIAKAGDILEESTEPSKPLENKATDDYIQYAKKRFPILNNLPEVKLQYDPNFKPREIGRYGDLEYMEAQYDDLPYYHNYKKNEEFKGHSTIVYNDKIDKEDIALDWLSHGLREHDPTWNEYLKRLANDPIWKEMIDEEMFSGFMQDNGIKSSQFRRMSESEKDKWRKKYKRYLRSPEAREDYMGVLDGLVRGLLVAPDHRQSYGGDDWEDIYAPLKESQTWKEAEQYILGNIESFQKGGSVNVIPEGALHARLHHMEDDNITKKGIPVVAQKESGEIEQQAEIERQEIIFRLEVTKKLEELQKKYYSNDYTQKEKDEFALEAGQLLVEEILYNTIDNTNSLI